MAKPEAALPVGHREGVPAARALARNRGRPDPRLRHTGPSVLLMQGIPGDVVRKITGHRSRELERYQHLSPSAGPRRRPDCPGAFQ